MISRKRIHDRRRRWLRRMRALYGRGDSYPIGRARRWGDSLADPPTWWYAWREGKPCSCYMCGNERRHFGVERLRDRRAAE